MEIRADPKGLRKIKSKGLIDLYEMHGRLYARAWPRKRGSPKDPAQRAYVKKFADTRRLLKKVPASQQVLAIEAAKGTGLYPQDLLHTSMTSGWFLIIDPDGEIVGPRPTRLESKVFQGCLIEAENGWTAPSGFNTVIAWDDPIMNMPVFWDPMTPQRLTVPAGVTEINVTFRCIAAEGLNGDFVGQINKNGTDGITRNQSEGNAFHGVECSTGPIHVQEGDFFEARLFCSSSTNIAGAPENGFAIQVLGTNP